MMFFYVRRLLMIAIGCLFLAGCPGGGGGGTGATSDNLTSPVITDTRVNKVKLTITNNFQRATDVFDFSANGIVLTVIALDSAGAPLSEVDVSLSTDSENALFMDISGKTDESGQFTTLVISSEAEEVRIVPTAGGVRGEAKIATFVAPVSGITLNSSAHLLPVGGLATLTALIQQEAEGVGKSGDPLPNAPVTVTTSPPGLAQKVPEKTDNQGQLTFTVTHDKAEDVIVRITSGPVTETLTLYFGASLALLPITTNAIGNTRLKALLKKGNQAPLPGQTITFNFEASNNDTLTPTSAATGEDGTTEVTVTDLSGDGGEVIVVAHSDDLIARSKINFLASFGEDRKLAVETTATLLATGKTAVITAKITDDNSLPVSGQRVNFSVATINGGTSAARLSITEGISNAQGEVETVISSDTPGENVLVTVEADTAQQVLPVYFGARLALSASTTIGVADGKTPVTLTATVSDVARAGIEGIPVSFRVTEGEALLESNRVLTDQSGQAQVNLSSNTLNTVKVTAKTDQLVTEPLEIAFESGIVDVKVDTVSLIVKNDSALADGNETIQLTIVAQDAAKAPISDLAVSLDSNSEHAFFELLSGTTDKSGHFTTTVTSNVAEAFEVTPTAGGKKGTPTTITFVAPVGQIVLVAEDTLLPVEGRSEITLAILKQVDLDALLAKFSRYFTDIVITTEALDLLLQEDLALPNTSFTVKVSSSTAQLSDLPTITGAQGEGKTDANGKARFTLTNNVAENVTVTLSSGAVNQTIQLYFGATLELLPVTTNTIETTKLTALLKDGYQSPLSEQPIQFNFVKQNNETLSPATVTTTSDGTAQVTVTDLGKDGGAVTVEARSGQLKAQAQVNFLAAFGDDRRLAVKTTATVLDTDQSATVTALITDDKGLPVTGQPVAFSVIRADGGQSQAGLTRSNGVSDEQGQVTTVVSDGTAENILVKVKVDTAEYEVPLYFGATLSLLPKTAHGVADGTTVVTLTATVNDASGHRIADAPVHFQLKSGQALLENIENQTDQSGRATVDVTSNTLGEVQVAAQADLLDSITIAIIQFESSEPAQLTLSALADTLSLNGELVITAEVKDAQGNPVKAGTPVTFTTNLGEITDSVLTRQGLAKAQFSATTEAGLVTITATAGTATNSLTLTIQSGKAGTIEVNNIDPRVIGIIGSGVTQSATIEFLVKDSSGNPVDDGTAVRFKLGNTTLGGGETITTEGGNSTTAVGRTNKGLAKVTVKSGTVAGNIDVIAEVDTKEGLISTSARVTVVSNVPDADHLSLSVQYHNIAGGVTFGLLDNITAFVGDRFGNIVPDNTSVSFITEGGTIGRSIEGGAFTSTTTLGQAQAVLQSAGPTTPQLGGIPTLKTAGYSCSETPPTGFPSYPLYPFMSTSRQRDLCGNPGLVTVVAYTVGSESFVDVNGNGYFDAGDRHSHLGYIDANGNEQWDSGEIITDQGDVSEPFIDGNDNSIFEEGELYVDVNNNGQFDGPDGQFQDNTTIWQDVRVLFSGKTAPFEVVDEKGNPIRSFSIGNEETQIFMVTNLFDIYGNALTKGSQFTVTTNNGVLGGTTVLTFDDMQTPINTISFSLSSNPPSGAEGDPVYPLPSSATVTITFDSPLSDSEAGGNGSRELSISGVINAR